MKPTTKIQPKVDNKPAPPQSLSEIEAEVGLPFVAMSWKYNTFEFIEAFKKSDECEYCGESVCGEDADITFFYRGGKCYKEGSYHLYGHTPNNKDWLLISSKETTS